MSDNWIIIVPESAEYVPPEEAQQKAVALFQELAPKANEVNAEVFESVQFIDCGANFERIICPSCGAVIDIAWWHERMDSEAEQQFPLKPVAMPCCSGRHNLQELEYEWPQAFARFTVEAMNPGIPDLSANEIKRFEDVFGCRVRKILRHI